VAAVVSMLISLNMLEMGLSNEDNGVLTLGEYQRAAMGTCLPESENFAYMMLNLVAELGELSGKVAKRIRKGRALVDGNELLPELDEVWEDWAEFESGLRSEAGDVLWQLSGLCSVLGWDLEEVARENLAKLADRRERGKIDGEGDRR